MPSGNQHKVKEVEKKTGVKRQRLKMWEKYGIFKGKRIFNKITGTEDRVYSDADILLIKWIRRLTDKGFSGDAIRIAREFYEDGKISIKWYK